MIRLIGAELARLRARRIVWLGVLATLVVVGLFQIVVVDEVTPPTAAERAEAQRYYDQSVREYEENREQIEEEERACREATDGPAEECDFSPDLADYGLAAQPFAEAADGSLLTATYLSALVAYLVACSLIGAEYTSGSISNWLTFVPQRSRVFAAKLVVAVVFGTLLSVLASVLALLVPAVAVTATGGSLAGLDRLLEEAVRGVLCVAIAATVGFCLTLLTRHTVAGIAALLAYMFVFFVREGLRYTFPWAAELTRWSPEGNFEAVRDFGTSFSVPDITVTEQGESYNEIERTITFLAGLGYWAVVLAVLVAVSLLVFRRRDVT